MRCSARRRLIRRSSPATEARSGGAVSVLEELEGGPPEPRRGEHGLCRRRQVADLGARGLGPSDEFALEADHLRPVQQLLEAQEQQRDERRALQRVPRGFGVDGARQQGRFVLGDGQEGVDGVARAQHDELVAEARAVLAQRLERSGARVDEALEQGHNVLVRVELVRRAPRGGAEVLNGDLEGEVLACVELGEFGHLKGRGPVRHERRGFVALRRRRERLQAAHERRRALDFGMDCSQCAERVVARASFQSQSHRRAKRAQPGLQEPRSPRRSDARGRDVVERGVDARRPAVVCVGRGEVGLLE
mmetsp:Transcript_23815/g.81396  ORF Transcript_23815/g.81396 Transcript_23815/m.81396 type:complete len:305 (-) Transcript_23815:1491-2405(-)